ncbi:antibiotic biosynthesis monooxygenase [Paenibacillus glycinis]|uniref:ABM domain-containing protein n=1 Tax=Paenibacillus glycinis TaxID=2697035 RepID=A0ABW9XP96_9BACL|nr:antibiotic biosynthesis monooxygenase [Paenibacillus glycinis]NBD24381.1 hypothetical protein [Paenibacillus glycinis]
MIIVENRFEIRAGAAEAILDRFRSPKSVHTFPGFVRMDVLHASLTEETEEVRVCTAWESEEAFQAWTNSDSFRHAHSRRGEGAEGRGEQAAHGASTHAAAAEPAHGGGHGGPAPGPGAAGKGPIISSKVTTYQVVVTHLPASASSVEAGT